MADAGVAETARIVRFHEVGGAEVLKLEEVPLPQPGKGEVRLRVKAIGLNRAEVAFRQGRYLVKPKLPSLLGYEASGIVEAVGEGVDGGLVGQVRSTVPSFPADAYGVYGEVAIVPADSLAAYPERMTFEEGTSIWMQYLTAWGALNHLGKMAAGDFVLITAASSSVGLAAIELANTENAIPIAATRTAAKKDELMQLGAKHVIVTDNEALPDRVAEITGGKGARLIFDPVGGPGLTELARAAAHNGWIFEYGGLSGEPTPFPLMLALGKQLTFRGYTLFEIVANPEMRAEAQKYIFGKLEAGELKPTVAGKRFNLEEIVEAHRYMEASQHVGKIVVTV